MNTKRKDVYGAIFTFFGVLIVTIFVVQGVGWFFDYLKSNFGSSRSSAIQVASAPETDLPSATTIEAIVEPKLKKLVLNEKPYYPNENVAKDPEIYKKESIKLIMSGGFKQLNLHIQGQVTEKGIHFLDFVFGSNVGALYGVRYSTSQLNTTATQQNGGVFTDQIDVKLDLLNPVQLSTTQGEFQKNKQATKLINLLPLNPMAPTYFSYLAAPFNSKGKFGGGSITSTLEYSCMHDDDCQAAICKVDEAVAYCMKDIYGVDKAIAWCKSVGYICSFPEVGTDKR